MTLTFFIHDHSENSVNTQENFQVAFRYTPNLPATKCIRKLYICSIATALVLFTAVSPFVKNYPLFHVPYLRSIIEESDVDVKFVSDGVLTFLIQLVHCRSVASKFIRGQH